MVVDVRPLGVYCFKFDNSFGLQLPNFESIYVYIHKRMFSKLRLAGYAFALAHRIVQGVSKNVKKCQNFKSHQIDF